MHENMATDALELTVLNHHEINGINDYKFHKPENEKHTWTNSIHFIMTCVSSSVGLGNVWRFPFTCYENGGGAFLIPYIIILILAGRPIYYFETCLGQFSGKRNVNMFESFAPAFKGVGYGQAFVIVCLVTYYSSVVAITLHYLINSFNTNLPWAHCKEEWNTDQIYCIPSGSSANHSLINASYISSSELWFTKEVLQEKTSIDDGIGWPNGLAACLLFATWLLMFVITSSGMKKSGNVFYFLAIFPYVVMFILLIRAVTLEGSAKGVLFFFKPQWGKLLDATVWYNALTQCFFSLNIGGGSTVMFSSFNKFDHNLYRDTIILTVLDTIASLMSGIITFGILGNLASELNVDITQVITSGGSTLAFVTYPDAIAKFQSVPWLFSILFFVMLFTIGLGSLIGLTFTTFMLIEDTFPSLKYYQIALITTAGGFLISLVYVTPGGQFILTMVDYFGVTFILLILTTVEVTIFLWIYGFKNFTLDVEFMLKGKLGIYWKLCWGIITPASLIAILVYFLATLQTLKYGNYEYPNVVVNCGWLITAIGISQPFIWWIIYLCKNKKTSWKKVILKSFSFSNWGPLEAETTQEWKIFKRKHNS